MDGLEATLAIRRLPGWESIPIVVMTANAFDDDNARYLQAGMNDHIAKPVDLYRLTEVLIKWLPIRSDNRMPPEEKVIDRKQVAEILSQLASLLETDDTEVNDVLDRWEPVLIGALGDPARRLKSQIQNFDYADALVNPESHSTEWIFSKHR